MQATQGRTGRVFVLRLESGDKIPGCIEDFARENNIRMGSVLLIGGIGEGQIVAGPRDSAGLPPEPMLIPVDGVHEIVGVGLLAPNKNGIAGMHMHASLGRAGQAKTGCIRPGIGTWNVCEVVIYEILDAVAARLPDEQTGFELLRTGHDEVK
jgi:uncharacterized protein